MSLSLDFKDNIYQHAIASGIVGMVVVECARVLTPFAGLPVLQAGLFTAATALIARLFEEKVLMRFDFFIENPVPRKLFAYALGAVISTLVSMALTQLSLPAFIGAEAVSIASALALAVVALAISQLQFRLHNPFSNN